MGVFQQAGIVIDPNSLVGSTKLTELPCDPTVPVIPPPDVLANRLAHLLSGDRAEFMEYGNYDENLETAAAIRFATRNPNVGPERRAVCRHNCRAHRLDPSVKRWALESASGATYGPGPNRR
jgi:hypothetical protein